MATTNSQLEALFTDESQIVDGLLRERLDPLLGLSRGSDAMVAKSPFLQLTYSGRILAYLLARHAMVRVGVRGATLEADAAKVANQVLVPLQRCREQLSRLKSRGLLESNSAGYFIPGAKLLVALEELAVLAKIAN